MNSFIKARFQRKLRKFAENPLPLVSGPTYGLGTGFRVLGPTFRVQGLGSRVPPLIWVPGPGSWDSGLTSSPGSRVPLFGYAFFEKVLLFI